jgi:hypothetical protein
MLKHQICHRMQQMLSDAMEARGEAQVEKLFECLGTVKEVVESCSGDVLKEDTGPFL